ncbi:MAG: SAM-dependent methyltransferase [Gammaproteobacteria bacterium]|nr:SAM-dependent methyltransferase [Gammaproteobacteria bacterium]
MVGKTINLTDELYDYMLSVSVRDSDLLNRLRTETAKDDLTQLMQITPDQGNFMAFIVSLIGSKRTIEVGVSTGYSSLVTAMALPDDGCIIACDVNRDYTSIAERYWKEAGVNHKIDLRIGPAVETLKQLIEEGHTNTFDFAFIDADKTNYDNYYEYCLQLLRKGGVIVLDNVFWGGAVIDKEAKDEDTEAIRAINKKVCQDDRVNMTMLPVADGLTLAMKL